MSDSYDLILRGLEPAGRRAMPEPLSMVEQVDLRSPLTRDEVVRGIVARFVMVGDSACVFEHEIAMLGAFQHGPAELRPTAGEVNFLLRAACRIETIAQATEGLDPIGVHRIRIALLWAEACGLAHLVMRSRGLQRKSPIALGPPRPFTLPLESRDWPEWDQSKGRDVVYFVEAEGTGCVKIGITGQGVESRFAGGMTMCPGPAVLLGYIVCASKQDSLNLESDFHFLFLRRRSAREWFQLSRQEVALGIRHADVRVIGLTDIGGAHDAP